MNEEEIIQQREIRKKEIQQKKILLTMLFLYEEKKFFKNNKHCIKVYNIFVDYCDLFKKEFKNNKFQVYLFQYSPEHSFPKKILQEILKMLIMIFKKIKITNTQVFQKLVLIIIEIYAYLNKQNSKINIKKLPTV